jgi:hypothetical protein
MGERKKTKSVITEPKFGKIFLVRYIIVLILLAGFAVYALYELNGHVQSERHDFIDSCMYDIVDLTKNLYDEEPGSNKYIAYFAQLRAEIAQLKSIDYTDAEVYVDGQNIEVDDTAWFKLHRKDELDITQDEDYFDTYNSYMIEDISYLDPVKEYMNGKFDERKQMKMYFDFVRDPIFGRRETVGNFDYFRDYRLVTAYINWKDQTFIPGVVKVVYFNEEYEIDCTPADTKGYEKMQLNHFRYCESGACLNFCYRINPAEPSDKYYWYIVPYKECEAMQPNRKAGEPYYFTDREHYMYEPMLKDLPWHVGIKARELSVFKLAPVSLCLIVIVYLLSSALAAFVWTVVKYQRDKTVWKIFEYRIKTTEAMAHDLKTPLSAIMAYAENIESSADDPEKTREYSRHISDRVGSMNDMIEGILAYSKSEAGNQSVSKDDVDVVALVKQSCEEFPYMLTDINGMGVVLETDRRLFKQVIDNLLSNCDRYGDTESVVDISIDPKKLVITNKTDKTYDDVNSLKKPFVKGEDSRGAKGTGLGLSIAENNLNILGYRLELVSEEGTFKAIIHFG